MKNSNDTIGNRTRALPACSAQCLNQLRDSAVPNRMWPSFYTVLKIYTLMWHRAIGWFGYQNIIIAKCNIQCALNTVWYHVEWDGIVGRSNAGAVSKLISVTGLHSSWGKLHSMRTFEKNTRIWGIILKWIL